MSKIISTAVVLDADKASVRKFGPERGLNIPASMTLDPEGFHVISTAIGQDRNVRVRILCKMTGRTEHEPVVLWMDMEWVIFNMLPTYEQLTGNQE
jgi:hypothetical protein